VRRDVNHPSVVFWANGNEGGWNTDLDDDFAPEDPQRRTVLHPWDAFGGIDTLHYAPYDCCAGKFFHGADLIMPTEFMHGLYDGGHGAGLRDYWNAIATHPLGAGGFLWVFADEGLVRTDRDGAIDAFGYYGADGILGPHREKEASFFTIRSLWSPVVIDERRLPTSFDGVLRRTRWRVRPGGWLTLEYELRLPGGSHPYFGITFDAPADQVTDLRWLGRGPYRMWKNRLDGMGFDVWASTANDTVTGESWSYPEFRGFFGNLYWATIGTRSQPITVVAETPGLYLRMLTPRTPKDPRFTAVAFPEGDISFMHAIPPIGTTFHAAAAYGPESQMNLVNGRTGTYTGTLHFAFGPGNDQ
jgi:hypothetical protein